jgi:hypothetical protein
MKKWYQSKKFWTVLVQAAVLVANEGLGLNLPLEAILTLTAVALGYLGIEGSLDAMRQRRQSTAIQDPLVREGIESLIYQVYDFNTAKTEGVDKYASSVVTRILGGLGNFVDPSLVNAHEQEIRKEIIRQLLKQFNADIKMMEGADLARS